LGWKRQTPFRDAYFAGTHKKRHTLIAACDIDGFIVDTFDMVERETNANNTDETRGSGSCCYFGSSNEI
jgi:hypothetical protein